MDIAWERVKLKREHTAYRKYPGVTSDIDHSILKNIVLN